MATPSVGRRLKRNDIETLRIGIGFSIWMIRKVLTVKAVYQACGIAPVI
jgi:hypothetical protein